MIMHPFKRILTALFCVTIYTVTLAIDCELIPFNSNYSNNYNSPDVFFIKGIKLKTVYHGIQIRILEDLKQNLQKDTIMVWCSDGISFRIANSEWYNDNDTLLMLITKTDLEGNDPGDLNDIPDDLEKPDDFMPIFCAYSILNYSNGLITGKITSVQQDTSMFVSDFVKQFPTVIKSLNYNPEITIYPNPANSELHFDISGHFSFPVRSEIYNSSGQIVLVTKRNTANYKLNLCSLTNGLFIIKIKDENNNCLTGKFIKQ